MYTLGINAAFHDSAACLVRDGVVLAAAEEERFTRIKHAKRPLPLSTWELPLAAIDVEHHLAREASAFVAAPFDAAPFDAAAVMTLDGRGERATITFGALSRALVRPSPSVALPRGEGRKPLGRGAWVRVGRVAQPAIINGAARGEP